MSYITDETIKNRMCQTDPLQRGTYENCTFTGCNFGEVSLSGFKFIDCSFEACNLSLTKLENTALQDVSFKDCKMLGIRFDDCQEFGLTLYFENCQLGHASFYGRPLAKTRFRSCQLQGADFTDSDLTQSLFDSCDLEGAVFDHTCIEQADLRTSWNFIIDPANNRIRKAKFSTAGLPGLLMAYQLDIVP